MNILKGLRWDHFQGHPDLRASAATLRSETDAVVSILKLKRDTLKKDSSSKKRMSPFDAASTAKKRVPAPFRRKNTVETSGDAFYVEVDSSFNGPRKKTKRLTPFVACARQSVVKVFDKLREMDEYEPLCLNDDIMRIDHFTETRLNQTCMSSRDRASYRVEFRGELMKGHDKMCIAVWGLSKGGYDNPDIIYVWRIPVIPGSSHGGKYHLSCLN